MQSLCKTPAVPLFDREQHRSSVPTKFRSAVARSGGQGRPRGRSAARALPWTAASTAASLLASGRRFNHQRSERPWTL